MSVSHTDPRDLARRWQAVLGRLQLEVAPHNWETWLKDTRAIRWDGTTVVVEARTAFNCEWLEQRLSPSVTRVSLEIFGEGTVVAFVPRGTVKPSLDEAPLPAEPTCNGDGARTLGGLLGSVNAHYTFERYLPAEGNQVALESCRALLEVGECRINPVVIYGAPGMGKTHLLHALATRAAHEGRAVACLSAEQFANRYLAAFRSGNDAFAEFQIELRSTNLLIIDDLQYLAGREGTLRELVHTIDAIINSGGDVVVASEVPPHAMGVLDRLASRLMAGIVARVSPFHLAERRAFIEQLAREHRVSLPGWAIERMAGCEVPSVRVLQGAVHAAVQLQRLNHLDLRRLDAELTVLSVAAAAPAVLEDRELLDAIAGHFGVTFDDLLGRGRRQQVTSARATAAAALRERGRSLSAIGNMMGKRDRGTVRELSERGQRLLEDDELLRRLIAV